MAGPSSCFRFLFGIPYSPLRHGSLGGRTRDPTNSDAPTVPRRSSSPPSFRASGRRRASVADGSEGTRRGTRWGRIAARALDGGCRRSRERQGDAAAADRRTDATGSGLGGVHRRHAHPGSPRLGSSRQWRGAVDDPAARSGTRRLVRRRAVAMRRVRAGGDRFRARGLAGGGRAPNEAGAGIGRRPHRRRRGGRRIARWRRGPPSRQAGSGQRRKTARRRQSRHDESSATHHRRETHDHSGGKGRRGYSSNRGGRLCNWSGASAVCVFRGSRSAGCGAPPDGATWERPACNSCCRSAPRRENT
jgi:hypothetical protein